MSVDKREMQVVVTQRQIKQVVSAGTQGPRGGNYTREQLDSFYDPLGAADDAEAAAAADATIKANAAQATAISTAATDATIKANAAQATAVATAAADASAKDTAHVAAPDPHPQYATDSALSDHTGNTSNPHGVTKAQVGLGNVDNTSDANKPVSTAQQTALNLKVDKATTISAGTGLSGGGDLSANRTLSVAYGTTAGTAAQGNDSRLSDAREWTAATVDQAEAEAGTATTRRAWTAQRVRQAIVAWWNSITNIDGKNIGATTAGTGRFTTLTTTGNAGLGTSTPQARLAVSDSGAIGYEVSPNSAVLNIVRQIAFNRSTTQWVPMRYQASEHQFWDGSAERAKVDSTGLSVTGNLTATGNTTLGATSANTTTVSGPFGVGGAPNVNNMIRVSGPGGFTGGTNIGVSSLPTGSVSGTGFLEAYASAPASAASAYTVTTVSGYHAYNATKGAGSTITNQHGVLIDDQTQGTNNYGITSQVSAGANKRNLNITGTAESYLAGSLSIGATPVTQERLEVTASAPGGVVTVARLRNSGSTAGTTARLLLTTNTGTSGGSNSSGIESVATSESHTDCVIGTTSFNVYAGKLRITSTGVVRPAADNTQSLGEASFKWSAVHTSGISFPATQNASADANTFDDYERGNFTPTIIGTTTAGAGTYTGQIGRYTKVGNRVFVSIAVAWTAHTGTGNIAIAGLPFVTNATSGVIPVFTVYSNDLTYAGELVAYAAPSQTQVTLGVNASGAPLGVVPMDTSAQIRISGHYEV